MKVSEHAAGMAACRNSGVPHDRKVPVYGLDSGYNAVDWRAVLDLVARAAPNYLSAARGLLEPGDAGA
jgi:hypothetical protein